MKRNQIIDTIYLVQRKVRIDSMRIRRTGDELFAADFAFEFITVQRISPVYYKLKIIEPSPFTAKHDFSCFIWVHLIKPRVHAPLLDALKIKLPACFSIQRFLLLFGDYFLPSAKGECGKADINTAIFYSGIFLSIFFMDTRKVLRLVCGNPLTLGCSWSCCAGRYRINESWNL